MSIPSSSASQLTNQMSFGSNDDEVDSTAKRTYGLQTTPSAHKTPRIMTELVETVDCVAFAPEDS